MPETPTLAPTPAPAAPSPIAERRERAPTERSEGAARVTPAASPTSTSESGPTPADGTVSLSGSVKQGDQTAHRPLPGATVLLYLSRDIVCDGSGQGPIAGAAYAQATTDADGAFAFRVPPGTYLVAVEGGPECLPRRWHVGVWDPGAADPCAATALALEEDGQAYGLANVLYPDSVGCPTP
jgi:hypothetical protein